MPRFSLVDCVTDMNVGEIGPSDQQNQQDFLSLQSYQLDYCSYKGVQAFEYDESGHNSCSQNEFTSTFNQDMQISISSGNVSSFTTSQNPQPTIQFVFDKKMQGTHGDFIDDMIFIKPGKLLCVNVSQLLPGMIVKFRLVDESNCLIKLKLDNDDVPLEVDDDQCRCFSELDTPIFCVWKKNSGILSWNNDQSCWSFQVNADQSVGFEMMFHRLSSKLKKYIRTSYFNLSVQIEDSFANLLNIMTRKIRVCKQPRRDKIDRLKKQSKQKGMTCEVEDNRNVEYPSNNHHASLNNNQSVVYSDMAMIQELPRLTPIQVDLPRPMQHHMDLTEKKKDQAVLQRPPIMMAKMNSKQDTEILKNCVRSLGGSITLC